jgi:hypothetical protein
MQRYELILGVYAVLLMMLALLIPSTNGGLVLHCCCINSVAVVYVNAGAISKCQVGCVHIDLKYNKCLYFF